ncbi:MAG: hypothetical protein D9V47_03770 [Clostridia bacterium]|nr:MAG: hypothetical protein D9V47_03770 [Clostridia bacterium]
MPCRRRKVVVPLLFLGILVFGLMLAGTAAQAAVPRWPSPGWFAQFGINPYQPVPDAAAPPAVPAPPEVTPATAPSPPPAVASTAPAPRWPQPAWFAQFGSTPNPAPEPPAGNPGSPSLLSGLTREESQLLDLINRERSQKGLPLLTLDPTLVRLARQKSQDMVDNNYFGHESPTYGKVGDMLKAAGVKYRLAAENIGRGSSVATVHAMMMGSGPHRAAILSGKYSQVGVGVVRTRSGGVMVTEIFVAP